MEQLTDNHIAIGINTGGVKQVSGTLKFIRTSSDISKINSGDVALLCNDSHHGDSLFITYRTIKQGAVAIIREGGSKLDHGSLAAKELGVPNMINSGPVEKMLPFENSTVSIANNKIFPGKLDDATNSKTDNIGPIYTDHKVKINLGFPETIGKNSNLTNICDGVGFARIEFLLLDILENKHPLLFIKENGKEVFAEKIFTRLEKIVKPFSAKDKPVWIRTDDFSAEQLIQMEGGKGFETVERNANSGWRGIRRSISQPELLEPQLLALRMLFDKGYENFSVFPPMTDFIEEYVKWKKMAYDIGLEKIKFGLMVETPAAAITIKEFLDNISFMIIGSNDLTQFTLAIDRLNPRLTGMFDEKRKAVLMLMKHAIKYCKKKDIETSIGGEAGSDKSLIKHLVKFGIDGTSISPDPFTINSIRLFFKSLEAG